MTQVESASAPAFLTFDQIEAASDVGTETIHIEGWGGDVQIRSLLLAEVEKINRLSTDSQTGKLNEHKVQCLLLVEAVVAPKLEYAQALRLIETKSGGAVLRVLGAVMRLAGLTQTAVDDATKSIGLEPSPES